MLRGWTKAPCQSGFGWVRLASWRLVSSAFFRRSRFTTVNAWVYWSGGMVPRSGRSSGSLVARKCSLRSTEPDGNRRGLSSDGSGRAALLPASSSPHATIGVVSGRSHGSANSATATPPPGGSTANAGKKVSPTLTPARAAPLVRIDRETAAALMQILGGRQHLDRRGRHLDGHRRARDHPVAAANGPPEAVARLHLDRRRPLLEVQVLRRDGHLHPTGVLEQSRRTPAGPPPCACRPGPR